MKKRHRKKKKKTRRPDQQPRVASAIATLEPRPIGPATERVTDADLIALAGAIGARTRSVAARARTPVRLVGLGLLALGIVIALEALVGIGAAALRGGQVDVGRIALGAVVAVGIAAGMAGGAKMVHAELGRLRHDRSPPASRG